jgi:hypothetical protein
MTEEERKKLAELRKRELKEKELQIDLSRHLKLEERKREQQEIREKNENKYMTAAIIFFGTLGPLYLLLFGAKYLFTNTLGGGLAMLGISLAWMNPLVHGAIWVVAVVSVYRKRSVLDDLVGRI